MSTHAVLESLSPCVIILHKHKTRRRQDKRRQDDVYLLPSALCFTPPPPPPSPSLRLFALAVAVCFVFRVKAVFVGGSRTSTRYAIGGRLHNQVTHDSFALSFIDTVIHSFTVFCVM